LGRGHVQETTKEDALGSSRSDVAAVIDDNDKKEEMSISQEILVLDLGDEIASHYKSEPSSIDETDPFYTNGTIPSITYIALQPLV